MTKYNDFIQQTWAKGILVYSCEAYEKYHNISSRVFVDYLGIPEDPATGSATGCLAALPASRVFWYSQIINENS